MEYAERPGSAYLTRLKKRGCDFTSTLLKIAVEDQLLALGVPGAKLTIVAEGIDPQMPDKDPQILLVRYVSLYDPNLYLTDEVKIEVGIRSKLEPYSKVAIQSILNEVYPNAAYPEEPFEVQAVEAHKTFLEKAFLLHEEFKKPDRTRIRSERMSRHFYDLERIMDTPAGEKALADKGLYMAIIEHRKRYNNMRGLDYATLQAHNIDFTPPEDLMDAYKKDYETMREQMIYGDSLTSVELFERIDILNARFRKRNF